VSSNDDFMQRYGGNPRDMWQTASIWLNERAQYRAQYQSFAGNDVARASIKDIWAARSADLAETNSRFRTYWLRYLSTDDFIAD